MSFSAEEVEENLITKLRNTSNIKVQPDYDGPNGTIDYLQIESEKCNLAISFYGFETSIFIFDEKIMLIDDLQKRKYTLDHTYGNIIYAGSLRNLTHREILKLLVELTECFINCSNVHVEIAEVTPSTIDSCGENNYKILITVAEIQTESKVFSNIKIDFVN